MTEQNKEQSQVRVFSTKACPYCISLKAYLDDQGINYEKIDVGENQAAAEEMIKKSGQQGVPVTEIDGEIIIGFDKEKINKALEIKE
ncbi:MAG: NrdH-redoxin [Parcubacteria group bacterium]|jgi:glutaredoxin-like YruB-family protein|nr:NrdH-redoxin [Parcubacteria group bacterium]|tara:strand:+ start:10002 stop:10262 length:261 start_codon:yes stop_codon:yes gene_type:complete